jgi:hypothetical protein
MRLNRRVLVSVTLGVSLMGATTIAATRTLPPESLGYALAKTRAWAQENPGTLPTTLSAISAYSIDYRKAIQTQLSQSQRAALWREQLNTFLLPAESLSPIQRRMVTDIGAPLTEGQRLVIRAARDSIDLVFDTTLAVQTRDSLSQRLCERGRTVFSRRQSERIFATLGPSAPIRASTASDPTLDALSAGPPRLTVLHAAVGGGVGKLYGIVVRSITGNRKAGPLCQGGACTCNCHIGSFCDGGGCYQYMCLVPNENCCGCFNRHVCNGYKETW